MKILVKSDNFDICNRVKKFDCTYRVVYNNNNDKYEIYSTRLGISVEIVSGVPLSYVCTIPYNQLDARTINYLYDTSIDNIESIIDKIEADNNKLEREYQTKLKNQSLLIAENRLRQLT